MLFKQKYLVAQFSRVQVFILAFSAMLFTSASVGFVHAFSPSLFYSLSTTFCLTKSLWGDQKHRLL